MRCQKWGKEYSEGEEWEEIYQERGKEIYLIEGRKKLDIQQIAVFLFTFWETHTRSETTSENLYV